LPTDAARGPDHPEYDALAKHACAACGAQAEWDPARQVLACPYCGTVVPATLDRRTGEIHEIDLARTLREMPDELRGWQAEKRTVRCRSCQAVSVFDVARVGQNCEFCGSPELVDYEEIRAPLRPQSLLPFALDESRIRESMRRWYASKWLAPSRFATSAMVDTVHGLYVPYWTFDATVQCDWTADAGHYYYTTESYTDGQGRRRTRQVRHVRWTAASGHLEHAFDDQPIPGTRGIDRDLLQAIEPFPTADLVPYDTAYLSGFVIEHYQVVLVEAARDARDAMNRQLREMCARHVPGDTHRNLQIDPRYSGETFKHILVPVWLLAYQYRGTTYQLVANGCTGALAGEYPRSRWKIGALILLALLLIAVVGWLSG
jgi:predicted RNA-binding Zn-ribbon protein involved in translation (DUF1610 family)